MKVLLSLISLLFLPSTCLFASELNAENAQKFLHDSGLSELIDALPQTLEQQLNLPRLMAVNTIPRDSAQQAVDVALSQVGGQQLALSYLTSKPVAQALSGAVDFLASPLGQRIVAEERAAATPDAQLEMQAYAMQMASTPPANARISLIQDLMLAQNADQVILKLMQGTFYSVLDITQSLNPDLAKGLKIEMDKAWSKMKPVLSEQFSEFMLMGVQYSYRHISDEDLKTYIQFLNTPSGKAYWHTGLDIIDLYLKRFVVVFVEQLANKS